MESSPSPTAAARPVRRDMRRRLQEELDAVRLLVKKAEAIVADARDRHDANAAAAAAPAAKRSPRHVRSPPPRRDRDREELDRASDRRRHHRSSDREELDRARRSRSRSRRDRRSDREVFDRRTSRSRRRRRHESGDREVFDRERRRSHSRRHESSEARRNIRRPRESESETEPRKNIIDEAVVASSSPPCQVEEGEIAVDDDVVEEGEIAGDQWAENDMDMDIDICGGVSPVVVNTVHLSPPLAKKDNCGGVSPVVVKTVQLSPPLAKKHDASSSPVAIQYFLESSSSRNSDAVADNDDDASSKPDTTNHPKSAAATTPLEQEKEASPATQMGKLIAMAKEKQRLRRVEEERRMAREELEEMSRKARPIFDTIDDTDMKVLGLVEVQYVVTAEKSPESLRRGGGGGGIIQQLGYFLRPDN
uniref:Uncharacterized protein n=1 Tax=Leersia perrieri TaxID=77586 RepID=A0A0D9WIL2_9ORYZ